VNSAIKKEFILEGLCCGNCASKIERDISKLSGVSYATVDFVSKTLTLEITDDSTTSCLIAQSDAIVKRHDSQITMNEKEIAQPGRKILYLHGLCCADCAHKIESQVNRIEGVKAASLDFVSQKLTIVGNIFEFTPQIGFIVFLVSYLLVGGEVVLRALKNISKGQVFDENFLMSVATIGAFAIGEYPEGVAVMLFYQVGEAFQRLAVNRSRKSISALMDIRPDFANLKIGNEVRKV